MPEPVAEAHPLPLIEAPLAAGRLLFFLLDYDGTLVPIQRRPDEARPGRRLLDTLARLTSRPRVRVAVLSGRPLGEVRRLLPTAPLMRAGCHGAEIEGPGDWKLDLVDRDAFARSTEAFCREAEGRLQEVRGAFLEDKGLSIAVHTRLAAREDLRDLLRDLDRLRAELITECPVETIRGKEVWEVRPAGIHKGRAAEVILKRYGGGEPFLIAIGDDRTDQDTFDIVKGRGVSVLVGPGWDGARADTRLAGCEEVLGLLGQVAGGEWTA